MWILHRHNYQHRLISWLVIAAVFALTLLPVHMHLHHVDDASSQSHEHVIDLHLITDNTDLSHHESATVLSVSPDVLLKKLNDNPLLSVLLACLFTLFLLVTSYFRQRLPNTNTHFQYSYYHFTPPLRAPPLL